MIFHRIRRDMESGLDIKEAERRLTVARRISAATLIAAGLIGARLLYKQLTRFNFRDKVVVITGSSRGLGLILARQLAAKGARLVITSRSADKLLQVRNELEQSGADVLAIAADLTDREQAFQLIEESISHFGKVDVLINNASIIQVGPQDAMEIEDYEKSMAIHFWAPLYTMLAILPHFRERKHGRIANITSIGGKIALPHLLPYTSGKFALVGLSEGMNHELRKERIRVSTIVPHLMRTGSPRNITVKGNHDAEYAWFKLSGSSPLTAQDAEHAAAKIIAAIERGDSECMLSPMTRFATFLQGVAPTVMSSVLRITNRFLPENIPGGNRSKMGYESESLISESILTKAGDQAAIRNNEYLK